MAKKATKTLLITSALTAASAAALWALRRLKKKEFLYRLELSGKTAKGKPVDGDALATYLETLSTENGFVVSGGSMSTDQEKGFVFFLASTNPLPLSELGEKIKQEFGPAECICRLEQS